MTIKQRDQLIKDNLKLSFWHAGMFPKAVREDCEAEGLLALTDASRRYDPNGDVPFVRFAGRYIRGRLLNYVNKAYLADRREVPVGTLINLARLEEMRRGEGLQLALDAVQPPQETLVDFNKVIDAAWENAHTMVDVALVTLLSTRNIDSINFRELSTHFGVGKSSVQRAYRRLLKNVRESLGVT